MRIITTLLLLLAVTTGVFGQEAEKHRRMDITKVTVQQEGELVYVNFTAQAGKKAAKSGEMLTVTPIAISGENKYELTSIAVRGRKSEISQKRRAYAEGSALDDNRMIFINNGQTINYEASFPVSFLGSKSALVFESDVLICCNEGKSSQIAFDNLLTKYYEVVIPIVQDPRTTAEKIAEDFSFVKPVGTFTREGSMIVYYELDKYVIDHSFRDNSNILSQIISAISVIQNSSDSRVTNVVIAGYASPEGSAQRNEQLAQRRALALRDYIKKETALADNMFALHNGGADWEGLRKIIDASDMKFRSEVLDIIDNYPVWDARNNTGRMSKIMALDGGDVYRYMLREFFPELRNAAYLTVYFENL